MKILGNLTVKCKCGKLHPFDNEEADFDAVKATEKENGIETTYKWNIDFICGRCGSGLLIDYDVFEYPKGKFDRDALNTGKNEVVEKYTFEF
jgi:hypothetical protein